MKMRVEDDARRYDGRSVETRETVSVRSREPTGSENRRKRSFQSVDKSIGAFLFSLGDVSRATHTLSALALALAVSLLPLPMAAAYCVEPNPSRFQTWPKCKCKQRIEEGDLRWGSYSEDTHVSGPEGLTNWYWSHLACVSLRTFSNALLAHGSLAAIPGAVEHDLLDELQTAFVRAETVRAKSHDASFPRRLNFV